MRHEPRVVRNDWRSVQVPELGRWQPHLSVSVVIPAYNCQASLDLTLASLARQSYPEHLLEVIVVDDGSHPPLELPEIRPENCRLIQTGDHWDRWGPGHAVHAGVLESSGQVIHRLDADMIVSSDHVEAQARWHHQLTYAVTLGSTRFVDVVPESPKWPTPKVVATTQPGALFERDDRVRHGYIEPMLNRTKHLRAGDHLVFLAHVGATAALRRELYDVAGGLDTQLRTGEDTEFGYRLAQAGAVFVPERHSQGWHLGRTHMMEHANVLRRYNQPYLADRMAHPRWLRKSRTFGWSVPTVMIVMDVGDHPLELIRTAVDAILNGDERDIRLHLVGPWSALGYDPRPVLTDPMLELRLIAATYQSDPRVRLVDKAPDSAFPSPYLLNMPATLALGPSAIRRIVDEVDRYGAGLVRVKGPGGHQIELWRTAALGRAAWIRDTDESPDAVVSDTFGIRTLSTRDVGVVDLSTVPAKHLGQGLFVDDQRPGRMILGSVEVAGVRSLARATGLVIRLSGTRARVRVGRWLRPGRKPVERKPPTPPLPTVEAKGR